MKTISTILLFFGILVSAYSQHSQVFDFEYISDSSYFDFKSDGQTKNLWQIGKPNKKVFVSGLNSPHALVTDTSKPYPVNINNSFKIYTKGPLVIVRSELFCSNFILNGYYWVDSDSLSDFGKMEFSTDSGKTYFNLLTDSRAQWKTPKPTLTGQSKEWKMFAVDLRNFINEPPYRRNPIYKFSFISDNKNSSKDGLMYDKLSFCDITGGLFEEINSEQFSISPNPATENITIKNSFSGKWTYEFYGQNGNLLTKSLCLISDMQDVNISSFPKGIYELILRNETGQITGRKRIVKN